MRDTGIYVNFFNKFLKWFIFLLKTLICRIAQLNLHKKVHAAVVIQRNVRGFLIRLSVRRMHNAAKVIQKSYKLFKSRLFVYNLLEETIIQNKLINFYNAQATIIQKYYRGYASRKKILNYYKLKSWLKFVGKLYLFCIYNKINKKFHQKSLYETNKCITSNIFNDEHKITLFLKIFHENDF